jgi:hypothetical protein
MSRNNRRARSGAVSVACQTTPDKSHVVHKELSLDSLFPFCSSDLHGPPPRYEPWYDPAKDNSPLMAALDRVRHMCTRAELALPVTTVPGSDIMLHGIMLAIDDFAERETGHREYFWGRPHG